MAFVIYSLCPWIYVIIVISICGYHGIHRCTQKNFLATCSCIHCIFCGSNSANKMVVLPLSPNKWLSMLAMSLWEHYFWKQSLLINPRASCLVQVTTQSLDWLASKGCGPLHDRTRFQRLATDNYLYIYPCSAAQPSWLASDQPIPSPRKIPTLCRFVYRLCLHSLTKGQVQHT